MMAKIVEYTSQVAENTNHFMAYTKVTLQKQAAQTKNLKVQNGQTAISNNGRQQGTLPRTTEKSKGIMQCYNTLK